LDWIANIAKLLWLLGKKQPLSAFNVGELKTVRVTISAPSRPIGG